ncbi:c-type cytochrome [Actinopolymorpha singaporensis]
MDPTGRRAGAMRRLRPGHLVGGLVLAGALAFASCATPETSGSPAQQMQNGVPERGAQLINSYGCGTCHTVPGVRQADGLVGPPLISWAERSYIAGELTNKPPNLVHWIQDPQEVEPGTAMPDLNVTRQDAEDIAAYLYTLR